MQVGDKIIKTDGPITREMIKRYADASGDMNPIHINEEFASSEKIGLKGVIAHGMLSFGNCAKHISNLAVEAHGKVLKIGVEMRGMVRPGDTLVTIIEIKNITDQFLELEYIQNSKMPLKLEKDGHVQTFEGEQRGWVSEKEQAGIKTESTPDGILTYREALVNKGTAKIQKLG